MSAFKILENSFKVAASSWLSVFRSAWILIVSLHAFDFLFNQFLDGFKNEMMAKGNENIPMMIVFLGVVLAYEAVFISVWMVLFIPICRDILSDLPTSGQKALADMNMALKPLIIESIRVMAVVLRWSLLLIVPGVIQYVRLNWVPWIVICDPQYKAGRTDALEKSASICRGNFLVTLVALIVSTVPSMVLTHVLTGGNDSLLSNPVPTLFASLLTLIVNVYSAIFLFAVYRQISIGSMAART